MVKRTNLPFLLAQDIVKNVFTPRHLNDEVYVVAIKKIVVILGKKHPFFFRLRYAKSVLPFIDQGHDLRVNGVEGIRLQKIQKEAAAGSSAHDSNVHDNPPLRITLFSHFRNPIPAIVFPSDSCESRASSTGRRTDRSVSSTYFHGKHNPGHFL